MLFRPRRRLGKGRRGALAGFSRRKVLSSLAASVGAAAAGLGHFGGSGTATAADDMAGMDHASNGGAAGHSGHAGFTAGGAVDHVANGFDPSLIVRDFDWGSESKLPDGRTLREWELFAVDKEIEIAPGVRYAAWTFNGRIPGPTLRAARATSSASASPTAASTRTRCTSTASTPRRWTASGSARNRRRADPAGQVLHLRVRRRAVRPASLPLPRHAAGGAHRKGLYGTFIVDPKAARPPRPTSS